MTQGPVRLGQARATFAGLALIGAAFYVAGYWPADTSFLSYSLAGAVVIHAWSRPPLRELGATVAGALLFTAVYALSQGRLQWFLPVPGFFLGLGSLAAIGVRTIVAGRIPAYALPVVMLPLALVVTVLSSGLWAGASSPVADWVTLAFDERLGGQSAFALGRLFARYPWVDAVHREVYDALPLGMATLYAAQTDASIGMRRQRVVLLLLVTPLLSALAYQALPVVGPKFAFASAFPHRTPVLPQVPFPRFPLPAEIQRNGVPSMHLGWALLLWWGLRRVSTLWGWIATAFLVLTVTATLGLGQHYAVDLIVAVPFTAAVEAAFAPGIPWRGARSATVIFGGLATTGWVVALQHEMSWVDSPAWLDLSAAVVSVVVPLVLIERLPTFPKRLPSLPLK